MLLLWLAKYITKRNQENVYCQTVYKGDKNGKNSKLSSAYLQNCHFDKKTIMEQNLCKIFMMIDYNIKLFHLLKLFLYIVQKKLKPLTELELKFRRLFSKQSVQCLQVQ